LFLKKIDRKTPADLDPHLLLDNYATHQHPVVKLGSKNTPGSTCTSFPLYALG
jgi:hypothetical protein